jgi:hypothetical protein
VKGVLFITPKWYIPLSKIIHSIDHVANFKFQNMVGMVFCRMTFLYPACMVLFKKCQKGQKIKKGMEKGHVSKSWFENPCTSENND